MTMIAHELDNGDAAMNVEALQKKVRRQTEKIENLLKLYQ